MSKALLIIFISFSVTHSWALSTFSEKEMAEINNLYVVDPETWYVYQDDLRQMYGDRNGVDEISLKNYYYPFPELQPIKNAPFTFSNSANFVVYPLYSDINKPIKYALGLQPLITSNTSKDGFFRDRAEEVPNSFFEFIIYEEGSETFYKINEQQYLGTIWNSYKIQKNRRTSEEEASKPAADAYKQREHKDVFFCDRKVLIDDLYLQFPLTIQSKPVWIRVRKFEKYGPKIKEFKNSLFTFDNMPPVIESANGKTIFLVDQELKKNFNDKTLRLLDEKKDQATWHTFYGTRIEGGYVYFNIFVGREIASVLKEVVKGRGKFEGASPAEFRVHLKYLIRSEGSINLSLYETSIPESLIKFGLIPEKSTAGDYYDELMRLSKKHNVYIELPKNIKDATIN